MTFQCSCVFCDSDKVSEVIYQNKISMGRRRVMVDGFKKSVCLDCSEEFYSLAQIDSNKELMENSSKNRARVVFSGLVRALREDWDLTQKQAAKLFGAGATSVAKWEAGQTPSGPTALLIQCALHVPGVMEYLSRLAEIDIKQDKIPWSANLTSAPYIPAVQEKAYVRRHCNPVTRSMRTNPSSLLYANRYNVAAEWVTS